MKTMSTETIAIEVLDHFLKAFRRAVKDCDRLGKKMKIISEVQLKPYTTVITVEAEQVENYYHLGKKYATYRDQI